MRKPRAVSLVLLVVSFICGRALAQTQQPPILSSFFGLHVNQPDGNGDSFPVQVTHGNVRNWDVYTTQITCNVSRSATCPPGKLRCRLV